MLNKAMTVLLAVSMGGALASCSSTDSSNDGGDAGGDAPPTADGPHLFMLTPGDSCFKITAASNVNDGCNFGVGDQAGPPADGLVGASIPFNYTYDNMMATIAVGTMGALGGGEVSQNMAMLVRDGNTSDMACMWHEHVDATVTLTGDDAFTISASRTQSAFTGTCDPPPPATGMCNSTWTWTMVKDPTKSPTSTPPCSQ
jgi:hypothetical protein